MRDVKDELYSNKSNHIIQNYSWAFQEKQLKVMELLCSCYMTNYYDADKNTITISLSDFMHELGLSTATKGGWAYKSFEADIKKMSDESIIGLGFNGKRRIIRLINTVDFPTAPGETSVVCYMSEDFKECMKLQEKGNTKIELRTVCSMESKYTIRLYNLLRSWQGRERVFFDLPYLKSLLNITAKSYDNYAKFRRSVLDIAVNEINKKTNLKIVYKGLTAPRGKTKKITRVVFDIRKEPFASSLPEPSSKEKVTDIIANGNSKQPVFDEEISRILVSVLEEVHTAAEEQKLNKIVEASKEPNWNELAEKVLEQMIKRDLVRVNDVSPSQNPPKEKGGVEDFHVASNDPFHENAQSPHPLEELESIQKRAFDTNPLEINFETVQEKKNYIDRYLSNAKISDFCKSILVDIVPEDVHEYRVEYLSAIELILKTHISEEKDIGVPVFWRKQLQEEKMKNAVSLFTFKEWSRYKSKTKTTPFQHFTSNLTYWLQENKETF